MQLLASVIDAMCTHTYTIRCRIGSITRTNLELNDELVTEVMRRYGLPSKRAAVDFALRQLVGEAMSREEALDMEGSGWDADLKELRASGVAVLE
jgi:Arc/MetJ family transcription regulator